MFRPSTPPVFIVLLAIGLMGTPVTYRGGATEPHPHMFLQLWSDAASGSFAHQAHEPEKRHHHVAHGHANKAAPRAQVVFDDPPSLRISPFVVSDWGVPVLHAPLLPVLADTQSQRRLGIDGAVVPADRLFPPESPPPRSTSL
jgi:hypothetical protein